MNILNESLTFTVPLSFKAHSLAEKFRRQQSGSQKAKQVYLNTLAVYAVEFYLRYLGVETEVEHSDSRNLLYLKFLNIADLWVKSVGRLECCPVLPDSTIMQIPAEAREDRVGYVAVQLERSLKQATIIGFTANAVAELPLSQLRSLEEFPEFLHQLREKSNISVNLRRWLDRIQEGVLNLKEPLNPYELIPNFRTIGDFIEQGWQELEALLSPEELKPAFSQRGLDESTLPFGESSSFIERGKKICLATQVTEQTILLIVRLNPQSENDTNIIVEVRPQNGQLYLPETLQVEILNEQQKAVMQATANSTNQNIRFDFNAESGEHFSIKITWRETSVIEAFEI
jgi:hypothetical protein